MSKADLSQTMDVALRGVAFSTDPGWIDGLQCPTCGSTMPLHQPDSRFPDRMLATCRLCD